VSVFPRKKVSDQTPFNSLKSKKVRVPGRETHVHVLLVLLFNVPACVASQTLEPADLMFKDISLFFSSPLHASLSSALKIMAHVHMPQTLSMHTNTNTICHVCPLEGLRTSNPCRFEFSVC